MFLCLVSCTNPEDINDVNNQLLFLCFQREKVKVGEVIDVDESSSNKLLYGSVTWQGVTYKIGDSVYLMPEIYSFSIKPAPVKKTKHDRREVRTHCSGYMNSPVFQFDL